MSVYITVGVQVFSRIFSASFRYKSAVINNVVIIIKNCILENIQMWSDLTRAKVHVVISDIIIYMASNVICLKFIKFAFTS